MAFGPLPPLSILAVFGVITLLATVQAVSFGWLFGTITGGGLGSTRLSLPHLRLSSAVCSNAFAFRVRPVRMFTNMGSSSVHLPGSSKGTSFAAHVLVLGRRLYPPLMLWSRDMHAALLALLRFITDGLSIIWAHKVVVAAPAIHSRRLCLTAQPSAWDICGARAFKVASSTTSNTSSGLGAWRTGLFDALGLTYRPLYTACVVR